MKVYAHYKGEKETGDGNSYRWRTLLQFGDSWECIGSVFMKNPGSATPLTPSTPIYDKDLLEQLLKFSGDKECGWFHFSDDPTMRHIENLFRTYYKHKSGWDELNGVIQIFNLMNVMGPNLNEAKKNFEKANYKYAQTIEKDILQLVSPVYLGWSELGKEKVFREKAEEIFIKTRNDYDGNYLKQIFTHNSFYHPQYLMSYGKNKKRSQRILSAFCLNTNNPQKIVEQVIKPILPKNEVYEQVTHHLETEIFKGEEPEVKNASKCRFKLNKELEITITTNEKGYVGIRHSDYKGQCKYSAYPYPNTQEYRAILEKYKYKISQDAWIGQKSFNSYNGDNVEEVVNLIVEEVAKIKKEIVMI